MNVGKFSDFPQSFFCGHISTDSHTWHRVVTKLLMPWDQSEWNLQNANCSGKAGTPDQNECWEITTFWSLPESTGNWDVNSEGGLCAWARTSGARTGTLHLLCLMRTEIQMNPQHFKQCKRLHPKQADNQPKITSCTCMQLQSQCLHLYFSSFRRTLYCKWSCPHQSPSMHAWSQSFSPNLLVWSWWRRVRTPEHCFYFWNHQRVGHVAQAFQCWTNCHEQGRQSKQP